MWLGFLLVGLGGALGASLRYGAIRYAEHLSGGPTVVGVFVINIVGSALVGALSALGESRGLSSEIRLLVQTGVIGGFTTFSAFALDTIRLWNAGHWDIATLYALGSVVCSLGALAAGHALARAIP